MSASVTYPYVISALRLKRLKWTTPVILTFCVLHLLSNCSVVMCDPRVFSVYQSYPSVSQDNQVEYDYRYAIDDAISGVISDRWEQRIGEFVKGAYSLLEPNGKIRTVNYEVDGKRGFHATVHTSFPANVLLSNQQLEKFHLLHPEPLINIQTRAARPNPAFYNQFQKHNDINEVPLNYHALVAQHRRHNRMSPHDRITNHGNYNHHIQHGINHHQIVKQNNNNNNNNRPKAHLFN